MKTNPDNYQFSTNINRIYSGSRNIPVMMKLKIWLSNVFTIIGLGFFIMGVPFSLVFILSSNFFDPSFSEKDPLINAIVIEAIPTNTYINHVRVYEYKYEYQVDGVKIFSGYGYSTGNLFSLGNEISVNYKANNPKLSKAKGLRTSEFESGITLFVLIFPTVGLIMLFFGTRKALQQIFILKIGELAEGKLLFKTPTNVKVNKQTVYALTFEFKASDGQVYQAVTKTHQYQILEDEEFEKLVYDPDMPTSAVLLDVLPNGIKEYFLNNY